MKYTGHDFKINAFKSNERLHLLFSVNYERNKQQISKFYRFLTNEIDNAYSPSKNGVL